MNNLPIELLYPYIKDQRHFDRYIKFITLALNADRILESYENHHILPRAIVPSEKNNKKNLVKLTHREHYVAHWLLAKALSHNSVWYSFNMMNRIFTGEGRKSSLYEYARKYIGEIISKNNKGRVPTQEERDRISARTKNTVIVKDTEGNRYRVSRDDPRYISGELISNRWGYKHPESTKNKISANNGVKGKSPYQNLETGEILYLPKGSDTPEGYIRGYTEEHRAEKFGQTKGMTFYHDTETGKTIRTHEDLQPPRYIRGRNLDTNPGWEKANSMINVTDLKERIATKVFEVEKHHAPFSSKTTVNTIIYTHGNKLAVNIPIFIKYLASQGIHIHKKYLKLDVLPITEPHLNTEENVYAFSKQNVGKTRKDFGIEIYKLTDFEYNEDYEILWI